MKTVAFVPVKLNNQRTPGKNIKKFDDGTALITVFLKTLIKSKEIDELYVFCSDDKIKDYLVPGVKFLKRPEFLDTQSATPQDIISEFMKEVDADIYAVCHCTSPFVTLEHINECFSAVKYENYDSSFTAEKIQRLLWKDDNLPLNFDPQNIPRTQDLNPIYNEVSAAYVFRKDVFLNLHRRIGNNPHITEVSGVECVDIDYPEDFEIANALYMRLIINKMDGEF
ncbi:CMP-N-acetylneuraminic acid synthetase [bacterium]|nr:CMP-N-acetylneuraminic acid synthetase [bacterium]